MRKTIASFAVIAVIAVPAVASDKLVERGRYLVEGPAACGNCHSPKDPDAQALSGYLIREYNFSTYAQNITPGSRISEWTDDELKLAIREGIRPDGTLIGPPMPIHLYRKVSDQDLSAIVAYLRTVPSVETDHVVNEYPFSLPPSYGPAVGSVPEPSRADIVEYGAYLAGPIAHCIDCHSLSERGPDLENNLGGGGGHYWEGPWGRSEPSNITNGPAGLADFSDAEIAAMITKGVQPDGSNMLPPMPYTYYAMLTDEDLGAIIAYLRTLPPLP